MNNRLLFDVPEAAEVSNVGPAKIREEIKSGRLAARRLGKRVLITVEDLRIWIDNLPRIAAQEAEIASPLPRYEAWLAAREAATAAES
jgi:excisionase family DNA binding protein